MFNKVTKILSTLIVVVLLFSCQKEIIVSNGPQESKSDVFSFEISEPLNDKYIVLFDEEKMDFELLKKMKIAINPRDVVINYAINVFKENNLLLTADKLNYVYCNSLVGLCFNASFSDIELIQGDKRISLIEQDQKINLGIQNNGRGGNNGKNKNNDEASTQVKPWGITRVKGGETYTGNKKAWILDTGIDLKHPDLNVNTQLGFNAFRSGRDSRSLDDGNGHGTHVAGTIAAIDNNIGVIGVAAGAVVIPVKVLGSDGSGSISGVIAGIDHVAKLGNSGDVANLSLGGGVSSALDNAVLNTASKGIFMCLAAGNNSSNANNYSPARVNGANIFTVSAYDVNDVFAWFSNFGNPPIDYSAPGVNVNSTWRGRTYNTISGTSMATPHIAGLLLLGNIATDGTVKNDRDSNPDLIAIRQQ